MLDALKWWLAIQALALAATPLCLALFAPLADRGYGLSKAFGLLLFGYGVWLLGLSRLVPNGPVAYGLAIGLIAGSSFLVWQWSERDRGGWRAGLSDFLVFWRRRRGLLLIQEGLFLGATLLFVLIRAYSPNIEGTEKFMDFAFMNAVTRSSYFPPFDPWLAASPSMPNPTINYYHFGYLIQGMLVRLTGVHPAVGFNLALASLFGLTATGSFSLCYGMARDMVAERMRPSSPLRGNPSAMEGMGELTAPGAPVPAMIRTERSPSWSFKAARPYLITGALGAYLLLGAGNLWTFLRRIDGSGMWEKDFWQGVGWNATRVLVIKRGDLDLDYTINEFPIFSFLLGDLHPHVLALPFVVLAVGLAYAWLIRPPLLFRWALGEATLPGPRARWRRAIPFLELVPGALLLGSLYFLNSWDFPAYFVLAQAAAVGGACFVAPGVGRSWVKTAGVVALVGALAIVLFLPFHLTFRPPVLGDATGPLPIGLVAQRSFLNQFVQFWGVQLALLIPVLVVAVTFSGGLKWTLPALSGSWRRAQNPAIVLRETAGWEAALLLGGAVVLTLLIDRLGSGALALTLVLATGAGYAALRALDVPHARRTLDGRESGGPLAGRRSLAFAFGLICLAALLLAVCEVVHIRDFYGGALRRMNTVFKFYYQAWLLLALGGAVAAFWLYRTLKARRRRQGGRIAYGAFLALGVTLLIASLHFPIKVTLLRTNMFRGPATLNGMDWMQRFHPEDYAAAEWLRGQGGSQPDRHVPVVLEATGGAYSEFSRMATQTGFPTVLGWDQHERLWRGAGINAEVDTRKSDVDTIYGAASLEQVGPLLDKYGITYIVVGYLEQQKYGGGGGLVKFERAGGPGGAATGGLERVFQQRNTAIYRVTS